MSFAMRCISPPCVVRKWSLRKQRRRVRPSPPHSSHLECPVSQIPQLESSAPRGIFFFYTGRYSGRMKNLLGIVTLSLTLALPSFAAADVASDVHIAENGMVVASNVIVMQVNGANVFVRG